jgi:hypothetical protein
MAWSPAATATAPAPAACAQRNTRTIMGTPSMSAKGLSGSLVAAMRAGMMTMGFMQPDSSVGGFEANSFVANPHVLPAEWFAGANGGLRQRR